MAIEIDRLSELLLKMADENAPGREFSAAIAELARSGRFAQLKPVLPAVVYDELWQRYQSDSAAIAALRDWLMAPLSRIPPAPQILAGLVAGAWGGPLGAMGARHRSALSS